MVQEHQGEHSSRHAAIRLIASKINRSWGTLRNWIEEAESSRSARTGTTTDERERIIALEREVRELHQAKEILHERERVSFHGGARLPLTDMKAFIDEHRDAHVVEPICKVLLTAPSTNYAHAVRQTDPAKRSARARSDVAMMVEIGRVFDENFGVCGVRKIWRQLGREGIHVARCTVARLMRVLGLQGVVRGTKARTTVPYPSAACPLDRVNR